MLGKRDVENALDRVVEYDDVESWNYWRDSGTVNCWLHESEEWLLQASHVARYLAITDLRSDSGPETVAVEYSDDELGMYVVMLAGADPEAVYDWLAKQNSTMISGDITIGE